MGASGVSYAAPNVQMEVGGIVVVISLFVLVYVLALWYLLTRCIYRRLKDTPAQPVHLHVVIEDDAMNKHKTQ